MSDQIKNEYLEHFSNYAIGGKMSLNEYLTALSDFIDNDMKTPQKNKEISILMIDLFKQLLVKFDINCDLPKQVIFINDELLKAD